MDAVKEAMVVLVRLGRAGIVVHARRARAGRAGPRAHVVAALALKQWTSATLGQSVISRRAVPLLEHASEGAGPLEI